MGKVVHSSLSTRVLKALGLFGSLQIITLLCAVIRTKLVALWIGTAGVGIISLYNATLDLLKFVFSLDINQCAVPEIAKSTREQRPAVNYTISRTAFIFGATGSVITLVISPVLSRLTFGSYSYTWGFALLSPTIFFAVLTNALTAILQGNDRLKELARATFYGSLSATAAAIPLFYFLRYDAIVPVLLAFNLATMIFLLLPHVDRPTIRPGFSEIKMSVKKYIHLGGALTLGISAGMAADYLLRVYINSMASLETVGIFQAGVTIIKSYVGMLFTAICMEYFPRLSATINKNHVTSVVVSHEISMSLWILMPVVVAFISADKLIVDILYSESFMSVLPFLMVAIASTFFRAISWCLSLVIVARGDSKRYIATEVLSGISLLTFGVIGWHFWGLLGVGMAITGQFIVHAAATWWVYSRYYKLTLAPSLYRLTAMALAVWCMAALLKLWLGWWAPIVLILPWLLPLAYHKLRN